jgi:hypothetical protein
MLPPVPPQPVDQPPDLGHLRICHAYIQPEPTDCRDPADLISAVWENRVRDQRLMLVPTGSAVSAIVQMLGARVGCTGWRRLNSAQIRPDTRDTNVPPGHPGDRLHHQAIGRAFGKHLLWLVKPA